MLQLISVVTIMKPRVLPQSQQLLSDAEQEGLLLRLALAERKLSLATHKLTARNQEIAAIYRLSATIGNERHINRLCEKTVEEVRRTLGAATVTILLCEEHSGDLVTAASSGAGSNGARSRVKAGSGLLWQVMKNGKPLQIPGKRSGGARNAPAGIAAPLKTREKNLGVIYALGAPDARDFTARERALLSSIASQAAVALDNATLYHDLENLFVGIAWSFAAALDAKSPWTAGHSKRVTQYSVAIAEQMNMTPEFLHSVRTCGLLHDIGKIGISERILDKPAAISRAEHKKIAEHATQGAKILEHIDTFQPLLPGIRHHHEKWDGSGFPDGLEREEIPLLARVLTVADSYDAITSDRPYRGKRSRFDAIAEIKRCAGTQFDPAVVEAFVEAANCEAF